MAFGRQPPGSTMLPVQSSSPHLVLTPGYSLLPGQATRGTSEVPGRRHSVTVMDALGFLLTHSNHLLWEQPMEQPTAR